MHIRKSRGQCGSHTIKSAIFALCSIIVIVIAVACQPIARDTSCTYEPNKTTCVWEQYPVFQYAPLSSDELRAAKFSEQNLGDSEQIRFALMINETLTGDLDLATTTAQVVDILRDDRGWQSLMNKTFVRVPPNDADIKILIAPPSQVDRMCRPLRTGGYLSCRRRDKAILNVNRWNDAVPHWPSNRLDSYRAYLINHEVGHFLGKYHVPCPGRGRSAPVMMQQSKSLDGCKSNGWPNLK